MGMTNRNGNNNGNGNENKNLTKYIITNYTSIIMTTQRGYWNRYEMMRKINKQVDRRPIMKAIIRRMNCLSSQFSLQFQHNYSHLADSRLAYHDNAESSSSSRGFRGLAADSAIAIPELRIDTNQTTCQSDDRATQDATSHPFQK